MEFWIAIRPILQDCLIGLIIAVSSYVIAFINKKNKAISEELEDNKAAKYYNLILSTIATCVANTNQTYVNALKDKNMFDDEAQKVAFRKSKDAICKLLNEESLKFLQTITSDVNEWVNLHIEAEVSSQKKEA